MRSHAKKLNLNGLTKRWIINVLSVVLLVLTLLTVILAVGVHRYYYNAVTQFLDVQTDTAMRFFSGDAAQSAAAFENAAKEYVESFTLHDTMEVQMLASDGTVLMSTAGYPSNAGVARDYADALTAADHRAVWEGRIDGGERVMSVTSLVLAKTNASVCVGAVRILVSLVNVDRQYWMLFTAILLVVLGFFLVIVLSGLYFVNSIVTPIQSIGKTARQIAHGDFNARIQAGRRDDEVGALCDTINAMAEELASTENMKNEFISSVSHELRTPLTAIKGWGETVAGSMDDPALVQKGMDVIISEAERLSVIVEDLLDFSRMQNGKLTYHMKPCDVVAEMDEAVLTLADTAEKKHVLLDFTEPVDIPVVIGDAVRLQQVFVNVLDNALKYTPEQGSVVVDIKSHPDEIEIMISDSGCGIAPEDLDHIKQKFYKGKDAVRGSGIGLAIADEIVTAHGGRLTIASTLHVGTTVTITLPVQKNQLNKEETA